MQIPNRPASRFSDLWSLHMFEEQLVSSAPLSAGAALMERTPWRRCVHSSETVSVKLRCEYCDVSCTWEVQGDLAWVAGPEEGAAKSSFLLADWASLIAFWCGVDILLSLQLCSRLSVRHLYSDFPFDSANSGRHLLGFTFRSWGPAVFRLAAGQWCGNLFFTFVQYRWVS